MGELEEIKRSLQRERAARKEAERILEEKSLELFEKDQQIRILVEQQQQELESLIGDVYNRQRELKSIFAEHPFPLLIYDMETLQILDANQKALSYYGYPEETFLSMSVTTLHPLEEVSEVIGHIQGSELGKTGREWQHVLSNGDIRTVRITGVPAYFKGIKARLALIEDVTEKKIFDDALRRSEEKYRSIIENMNLGLIEVDRDGIITKAYDSFCRIVGYTPKELEGTDGVFLLDEEGRKQLDKQLTERRSGKSGSFEVRLISKSGANKWVVVSGAPFFDENNNVLGSVGIHLEITEHKHLQEELLKAKNSAEESLRTKELFLANISHEIRTPLNAIVGIGELLQETAVDRSQRNYLTSIKSASNHLMGIINDLLLLAQEQAGEVKLVEEPHHLNSVVKGIFDFMKISIGKKSISYNLDLDAKLEVVQFDRLRLSQTVQNLLSNAIKFTEDGSVVLQTKLMEDNATSALVEISVTDTGIGIPSSEKEEIFNSFSQASNNNPEIHGGTGLGLYIVHSLVEKMGGEMEFESSDEGTKFTIQLNLKKGTTTKSKSFENDSPINLKGTSILVAEDNTVNQVLVQTILESAEVDVEIANNGLEVLEKIEQKSFDAILMDIRMPDMDGLQATKELRTREGCENIPIIALTANNVEALSEVYIREGMDDVIGKPFVREQLFAVLDKHLRKYNSVAEKALDRVEAITGGDGEMAAYFIKIFREESAKKLLELNSLNVEGDRERIEQICHSLKPSLQQVAGNELYKLARSIENDPLSRDEFGIKLTTMKEKISDLLDALGKNR